MTFRDTLTRHLTAIQERNITALAETVAEDSIVLITAEGKLVTSTREFLDVHRDWFAMTTWTMGVTPVSMFESPGLGVAVFELDYRETPIDRPHVRQKSYLTLVFQERNGRWVMVQDQNTPVRAQPSQ